MILHETYSQLDLRWSGLAMGSQGGTVGSQGCTLTAICNGLKNYQIFMTPDQLLAAFNATGVRSDANPGGILDDGGFIFWPNVPKAIPGVHFHYRYGTIVEHPQDGNLIPTAAVEKIRILLALGFPVPVKVMGPAGQHWLTAIDWSLSANDLRCVDPGGGREILFGDKYGPLEQNLYAFVALIGDTVGNADGSDQSILLEAALCAGKATWKTLEGKYQPKEIVDTFI